MPSSRYRKARRARPLQLAAQNFLFLYWLKLLAGLPDPPTRA